MPRYVVTGAAGFIGSHVLKALLEQGHDVIGVDNLWTGSIQNLYDVFKELPADALSRFQFFEEDIRDFNTYQNVDAVFHLAALGSVPRSVERPLQTHQANVDGFFMAINRAYKNGVKRFIYSSSSSVYGSSNASVKAEHVLGMQTSPYSATKRINEIYAEAFYSIYKMECVGLRYFNVYGPRQNPEGAYAAVIPKWIRAMKKNEDIEIYGDGEHSRDFTFVKDVVSANLAGLNVHSDILRATSIFNVGTGKKTTLNELFQILASLTGYQKKPIYLPERKGDRKQSCCDPVLASWALGYCAHYDLEEGLKETLRPL